MKLPNGWKFSDIDGCAEFIGGSQPPQSTFVDEPQPGYVRLLQIRDYKSDRYATYIPQELSKRWCESDDIMIGRYGPPIFQILRGKSGSYNVALIKAVPKSAVQRDFLFYTLKREDLFQLIDRLSSRTSGQTGIDMDALKAFPLALPPLPEQRKIADILSTWDEALEALDALIAAKDRQKQALMQQLLTGKTRVKGAKGKWQRMRFADWLTESRIQGTDGSSAKKITVKLYGRGVYSKQDRLVGSENTKYYIRRSGQFIYSKLDFLNGAFGIVPESLDGYESTLDLPSFDVSPNADAKWLLYYVTRPEFYTQQLGAAAGGRKARRVNPSEFLAMKILAPDFAEQQQIAAILDTADQELTLLRTQRQTLDQQKRGLMQRLLTGKIRVTI
jgi:type I restriction enzyme S subunit